MTRIQSRRDHAVEEYAAPCSSVPHGWKKECLSELVGTYVLVVAGPSSIIVTSMVSISGPLALCLVAFTFGGTVAAVIVGLGNYSGSIINPAITLAAASARLLRRELVVPYLLLQTAGGLLAGLTLRLLFLSLDNSIKLGSTKLAGDVSPLLGMALEAIGTFVLTSTALVATTRVERAKNRALLVGTTLFFLILFIGPFTGAGFNPARSLGPALASGYFSNLYVYIVGPIAGAIVAGLLFRLQLQGIRLIP